MCRAKTQGGRRCLAPTPAPRMTPLPSYSAPEASSPADRVRGAYDDLARTPGDWVPLAQVRDRLGDLPRADQDAELLRLLDADEINIAPEPNQQALTPADRAAAIHIGGKDKHLLMVREQRP